MNHKIKNLLLLYFLLINVVNAALIGNEKAAQLDCFNFSKKYQYINLHDAVSLGCKVAIKDFLEKGGDPNLHDEFGRSLLYEAMGKTHNIEMVELLLQYGADPNLPDGENQSTTPLVTAIMENNYDIVKLMIDYNAEVNRLNTLNTSPLFNAVLMGHTEIVNLLLDSGADPHGSGGRPPIMVVSNKEIMRLLQDEGVDIFLIDVQGSNALMGAAMFGNTEIVVLLIDLGLDVNSMDNKGYTPLMYAILGDKLENVVTLVTYGADIFLKNNIGDTAISLAEKKQNQEIVDYLNSL